METLIITKVRLLKQKNGNGLELVDEGKDVTGKDKNSSEEYEGLIHNDLYNAIQKLAPHLAIMAFHGKQLTEDFSDFSVGSYSISGEDEKKGIIISGTLRRDGRAHNFNTPFYRFEEPAAQRYTFMDELIEAVQVIENEVGSYLDGTKRGEEAQGKLDLKDPADADTAAMVRVAQMPNTQNKPVKEKVKKEPKKAKA